MNVSIASVLWICILAAICCPAFAQRGSRGGDVPVQGYTRADGTYVQPYMRSAPDENVYNNWSTSGNYNPYTGQLGTKNPTTTGSSSGSTYPYFVVPTAETMQDQLQSWIGHYSYQLNARFGQPYKTHKQKDGYSVEYTNLNQRIEFFVDQAGVIWKWKTWAYGF